MTNDKKVRLLSGVGFIRRALAARLCGMGNDVHILVRGTTLFTYVDDMVLAIQWVLADTDAYGIVNVRRGSPTASTISEISSRTCAGKIFPCAMGFLEASTWVE